MQRLILRVGYLPRKVISVKNGSIVYHPPVRVCSNNLQNREGVGVFDLSFCVLLIVLCSYVLLFFSSMT